MKPENAHPTKAAVLFAVVFGFFLGLCVWKFGNPVILDHKIVTPQTPADYLNDAWPIHWANWLMVPLVAWGAWLIIQKNGFKLPSLCLWLLPLVWLGWQVVSAGKTVDSDLTSATLWQFGGCVACYFLGLWIVGSQRVIHWLLIGMLLFFTYSLVRGVNQRLFEFPMNYRALVEGQQSGWTNYPAANLAELKSEGIIINTNGVDMANPVILDKFARGRISGTLVYPNALAQIILLLGPVSLVLAFSATRKLRPLVRWAAIGLTLFLGGAGFFWTGSKLGWLIAIIMAGVALLWLDWSKKLKLAAVAAVLVLGLGMFAVRFHHYFAAGATSAGARFDYWRAAVQTTEARPWFGTGPGTFQRPYAQLKSPQSEMARLTHNDYLEQFSDSGVIGGLAYLIWVGMALAKAGWRFFGGKDGVFFAIFLGLLGWFIQGFGEFGLYVPALAWIAFTLMGSLLGQIQAENGSKIMKSTKS